MGRPSDPIRAAFCKESGGHLAKSGPPQVWAGRPGVPQGRHQGGHPQIEGGPNVAATGQMGRPWWPGGRPCGSRAAGDALAALAALNASTH
eukprot:scaffold26511_cov64-Phaeocystis_antarctica.AAC.3